MLNETDTTTATPTEGANVEYSMENVVTFPGKSKQATAFRVPASAVTPRYTPDAFVAGEQSEQEVLNVQRQNMIPDVADIYVREMFFKLHGMGFPVMSEQAEVDFQFIFEAVQSALYRMYGISHPLQEYVDVNFELVPAALVNPNKPMESIDTDPSETT